jgi:hypothetical protein
MVRVLLLLCLALSTGFSQSKTYDPLRSWNVGPTKTAIQQFVQDVTTEGGAYAVPVADRVAVVEIDGTLLPELPYPIEIAFGMDQLKKFVAKNPRYRSKEPFKSALAANAKGLASAGGKARAQMTAIMRAGLTTDEFEKEVTVWLTKGRIQKLNRLYSQAVFHPMKELVGYLRANGFRVYVIAGGTAEFVRPWAESVLGVSPLDVLGSRVLLAADTRGESIVVRRKRDFEFFGENAEKISGIADAIGRRPIVYVGHADEDHDVMRWVAAGPGRHLVLIVHHTDGENEFFYDAKGTFGKLDRSLHEAKENGWVVVDMLKDWNKVFTPPAK